VQVKREEHSLDK